MVGLLVNIHFLVTNGLSMNKGTALHSLVDFQLAFYDDNEMEIEQESSSTVLRSHDCQLLKTHRSSYSTWEFVHALNAVVETDDIQSLQQACYFSLLMDESNNVSNAKNLLLYCQYLDPVRKKVELKFIKLLPLKECDAQTIFTVVAGFLHRIKFQLKSSSGLLVMGASIVLGCNDGVQAKLKSIVPHLMEVYCVAHRELLAVSHAYDSVDYFVQLESTLRAIYSYFSYSSVSLERLKLVFIVLDEKFVWFQKLFDIYWLSQLRTGW